jgi:acetyl esterase
VPVSQLNEAIGHLVAHADEYGVDMSKFVLMGGSGGARISAQYGLLVSNPAYAAEFGIKPVLDASSVKGLVLFSPPLQATGFGWRMNTMLWSYLGTKDLEKSRQARLVDILAHVTPRYPPTYITDGNQPGTFSDHAKAMARVLREHQVAHVFNYYVPSGALLDHTYTGRLDTKHGRDNFEKAIAFIKQCTGLSASAGAGGAPSTDERGNPPCGWLGDARINLWRAGGHQPWEAVPAP